ncbi:DUF1540 domain-containing protein [Christensenellaceae bacterium OttesenSCG-928-M15]|nr:DUF1540 domain-containing protein [Christensenellaceae bacterium OttesenSCG-928-M15]
MSTMGNQYIGCEVTKCAYHSGNNACELNKITVKNCPNTDHDDTLCGSYRAK